MPIQPENKLAVPNLPSIPAEQEDLIAWAADISRLYSSFARDVVQRFNLHVDQPYAHPKSWATWKIPRPSFKINTSDSSQVVVAASSSQPVNFLIGDTLLQATSTLTMDLDTAGAGGLRSGLSKAANTIYYLYAVNNSGSAALLADTNAPSAGPSGYTDWTYLGAFMTLPGSTAIAAFASAGGVYLASVDLGTVSHSGDTSISGQTIIGPATAKFSLGEILVSGTAVGGSAIVTGFNDTTNMVQSSVLQVLGLENHVFHIISLASANTIYLKTNNAANTAYWRVNGWIEDPTEYP